MKAIILAAGKGTRLRPITNDIPKAMVEVLGKPLLEHNMERLLPYVEEFIIVVKYKKEKIIQYFGNEFHGKKVVYHEQGERQGTGAAIEGIEAKGNLVIAYADALFSQQDIDAVMESEQYSVLVKKVKNPEKYGIFRLDPDGFAAEVIEKPQEYVGDLANFSFFKVNDSILKYVQQIELSPRGELELTDAINIFIQNYQLKPVILQNDFLDITSVEDLESANVLRKGELGTTRYLENIGEYEIHLGIPKNGVQEIIDYTLDPTDIALKEGTSDWKKRFISTENLTDWYADDNRFPFTLLDKQGMVVGIWWGRPAKLPYISEVLDQKVFDLMNENKDNLHTSGVRIYPPARGKRLASAFIKACSRYYGMIFPNFCMSDDIDAENIASIKAFEKLGFQKAGVGKNVNNSPESGKKRFVYVKKYST